MTKGEVLKRVKKDKAVEINLQFTDLFGAMKSVAITPGRLPEALERGIWFDGSSIEGFARIQESDMVLRPDLNTYSLCPWEDRQGIVRFICDVYTPDGKPYESDPRYILRRSLAKAKKKGYLYNVGPELEFFFFKKENGQLLTHDEAGYFDLGPTDLGQGVRREVVDMLEAVGIEVEASHHEVASGQHEIDFKYGGALTTADRALTLKHVVKVVAKKYGLEATFMPKPKRGINGSGMHVHQSLFKNGKNVFYDAKEKYNLSKIALNFLAGQLKYIQSISAVTSPTVNSYKRLVPGYEAPVYICWGQTNRSALIRVPRVSRSQATRLELRSPDPGANPYLAFAIMLEAGLEGMDKKINPPRPVEEDVYDFNEQKLLDRKIDVLPGSLGEAMHKMDKEGFVEKAFGQKTYEKYLRAKTAEWDEYRLYVSDWEIENYLKF